MLNASRIRSWYTAGVAAVVWSFAISAFAHASNFAMNLLLARSLGKAAFGEWASVQNTVGTISGIAQLSMSVTALKFVAQFRESSRERVGRILGMCATVTVTTGLVAGLSLFAVAPWLASSVLKAASLTIPIRISVITLFLLTINGYQYGALNGLERYRTLASLGAFQGVAGALAVPLLARSWGVSGATAGFAAVVALSWLMYQRSLRDDLARVGIRVTTVGIRRELGVLSRFALPATLSGIIGMVAAWVSMVILVRSASGYAEMASLAVAATLRTAVLFAPNVIARVSAPVLTNLTNHDARDYARAFRRTVLMTTGSAAFVAFPIALFASPLLGLFGRDFRGASSVVAVMALSGVLEAVGIALSQRFLSHELMWSNLLVVIARSATLVSATYLLVPHHAALGAALGNLLAHLVQMVIAVAFIVVARPRPRDVDQARRPGPEALAQAFTAGSSPDCGTRER